MVEHAHHILGTCGEAHPSLLSLIFGSLGLTAFGVWVKYRFNQIKLFFKRK